MQDKSRANYFKERRKSIGQFNVSIDREKLNIFNEKLKKKGETKTEWLNKKIDEEISK